MPDEKKEEVAEGEAPKKDNGMVKMLIIVVGFIALQALTIFLVMQFFNPNKGKDKTDDTDTTAQTTSVVEEIVLAESETTAIVNIKGTDGMRFLKVTIEVAYDNSDEGKAKNKNLPIEALKKKSQLVSKTNEYLASLDLNQVMDPNAQQMIRTDLLREYNKIIPPAQGRFSSVYLKEYLIQ